MHLRLRTDSALLAAARTGDAEALGALWTKHYDAAIAAARAVTPTQDPEDVVQEAFARILDLLRRGGGPSRAFRPYLFATIRNTAIRWDQGLRDDSSVELDELVDPLSEDGALADAADIDFAARAYRSLPARWQEVLWYADVEQRSPAEIGEILGVRANTASALLYRAREGLRQAWIRSQVEGTALTAACRETMTELGAHSRQRLSPRRSALVRTHLAACTRCTEIARDADEISGRLGLVLLPLVLGSAGASAWTLSGGATSGAAALSASALGTSGTVSSGAAAVGAGTSAAASGTAAAGAGAVASASVGGAAVLSVGPLAGVAAAVLVGVTVTSLALSTPQASDAAPSVSSATSAPYSTSEPGPARAPLDESSDAPRPLVDDTLVAPSDDARPEASDAVAPEGSAGPGDERQAGSPKSTAPGRDSRGPGAPSPRPTPGAHPSKPPRGGPESTPSARPTTSPVPLHPVVEPTPGPATDEPSTPTPDPSDSATPDPHPPTGSSAHPSFLDIQLFPDDSEHVVVVRIGDLSIEL